MTGNSGECSHFLSDFRMITSSQIFGSSNNKTQLSFSINLNRGAVFEEENDHPLAGRLKDVIPSLVN